MTQEQIAENRMIFEKYCKEYIHREGIDRLMAYINTTDFYTAPSSASYHLNEDGGLCKHSINVFEIAMKLYETVVKPAILLSLIHI